MHVKRIKTNMKHTLLHIPQLYLASTEKWFHDKTFSNKINMTEVSCSWFRASAMTTMNKKPTGCTTVLKSLKLYCILLRDSSDRPKLEDTTNPTTHGDWRLYVQN
jgi:hypothetical protein